MANQSNKNIECVLRYGHCNGHTDCTFVDHNKLMTCGVDSEIRIWPIDDLAENDDYTDSFPISDQSLAVVANSSHFFIACDSNCVKSYTLTDGENETIVCRFETNATHLDISSDGQLLIASAADFKIKLVNLKDNEHKTFEGHEAPVLSIALDPKHRYIASSSCDTSVRIWNIENQNCVQFWKNCFPKSNDFENSQTLSRISWHPVDGQTIAVPKMDRIDVYKRDSWDLLRTFSHKSLTQISITAYSFDANYLAVASNDGIVMVWNTEASNDEPIAEFFSPKSERITSLKWNPKSNKHLCFCNINGQFGVLKVSTAPSNQHDNQLNLTQDEVNDMFADLSDDDFGEVTETPKEDTLEKDLALDDIQFDPKYNQTIEDRTEKVVEEIEEVEDEMDFDISAIKSKYESQIFGHSQTSGQQNEKPKDERVPSRQNDKDDQEDEALVEEAAPLRQEPFQSGSTPIHLEQRFMIWNSVGIVRSFNGENESSIDVEFHDTSFHHSIHIPNAQHNYTIADLSTEALVLATNGDESATNGKLFCILLNLWDATKEWTIEMPKEEFIEAMACGSGFIALATDKRYVRIFTSGGIQTHLLSIAGRIVCLSAFDQFLMIIYHSSSGMPEEQSLSMYVLRIDHRPVSKHPVPNPTPVALSPKSSVSWAGFTDEGTACVVDSECVIRLFDTSVGNTWVPIASLKDHAKGKSDNFFVIGLSEIQQQIRCIFCKGCQYPPTLPKPTLTILPIQMPLCEMFTAKGKHEEELMRNKMLAKLLKRLAKNGFEVESNLGECYKTLISSSIKLFALALGADRESLALEISNLMPNKSAVEGAIRYADRQKRRTLVQKLSEIAEQKLEEELNDEDDQDDVLEIVEDNTETRIRSDVLEVKNNDNIHLKPKPLRKTKDSSSDESDDESIVQSKSNSNGRQTEEECGSDEDSNSVTLKPKGVTFSKQSKGNPFKVTQKESKRDKRKRERDSSDESDEEEDSNQRMETKRKANKENAKKITKFFTRN